MFGFLVLNKPTGITSRRALDLVALACKPIKVGHAGTLDPLATGVLVLCLGPATRLVGHVQRMPKRYVARFRLGYESDTEDITGQLTPVESPTTITRKSIEAILPQFTGRVQQLPPKYSALKVAGKRAYKLARQGESFELEAREIENYRLGLTQFESPDFELEIECGSGTYVRSIGRDIGRQLGSGAAMTSLVRTAIGGFEIDSALKIETDATAIPRSQIEAALIAPAAGLQLGLNVKKHTLSNQQVTDLKSGKTIRSEAEGFPREAEWLAMDTEGRLIAVMSSISAEAAKPQINFANQVA